MKGEDLGQSALWFIVRDEASGGTEACVQDRRGAVGTKVSKCGGDLGPGEGEEDP